LNVVLAKVEYPANRWESIDNEKATTFLRDTRSSLATRGIGIVSRDLSYYKTTTNPLVDLSGLLRMKAVEEYIEGEAADMENISINKSVMSGRPVITGTRIPVYFVLNLIASGYTVEETIDDYPHINSEQIKSCLRYASKVLSLDN
jgi:uncharacterized protein (DUF433 family)